MGAPTLEFGGKTIIWQDFCRKLHENEINETEMDPAIKSEISVSWQIKDFVITAHKQSLRRLCFYTCLSVHRGSTWAGTHRAGTPPRHAHPPWAGTPWQVPPLAGTPQVGTPSLASTPPGQVHPLAGTRPRQVCFFST